MPVNARTLLFSHRNIYRQEAWRSSFREFENLLPQIESVHMIAPHPNSFYTLGKKFALHAGEFAPFPINPGIPKIRLNRKYDLFITICEKPSELLHLTAITNLFDMCKTTICWLPEFYAHDMKDLKSCLSVLSNFDLVLFMFDYYEPFLNAINGKGFYMPAGIDSLLFCPEHFSQERFIDVLSIGRRSKTVHNKLLSVAKKTEFLYVYDSFCDLQTYSVEEHRFLFSKLAKRAKYFIVNPGKIDSPEETGGQVEFGYRYFEGAAPGTIMIGEIPKNRQFSKIFNYPDAVIHMPFEFDHIDQLISELDAQPDRANKIRLNNIINSLLYFDWSYRWEQILNSAGVKPTEALVSRKKLLKEKAAAFS
jgi:hypothetical protein